MPTSKVTTESPQIKKWLASHQLKCLEEKPRGLQVKVRLLCLKHNEEFLSYIHLLQHNKHPILFCKKCIWENTKDQLTSGESIYLNEVIYSNPELVNKIIQKRGKYKQHKFIRYNSNTKTFEFFCEKANIFFTTKTLQSEIGLTKTDCEYCANETTINKSKKLAKSNHKRANMQIAKSKTYGYRWINGKRICLQCGQEVDSGRICRFCNPKYYDSVYKGYTQPVINELAKLKRRLAENKKILLKNRKLIKFYTYCIENEICDAKIVNIHELTYRSNQTIIFSLPDQFSHIAFSLKSGRIKIIERARKKSESHSTSSLQNYIEKTHLLNRYKSMPAKLGRKEIVARAKEKVSNCKDIQLVGVNQKGTKIKYICTKHNLTYIKAKKNFFWAHYLCDKCRKENIGKNISKGLTQDIQVPESSSLTILDDKVTLTRQQAHTLNTGKYGILVKCKKCGQSYLTSLAGLKRNHYKCTKCELPRILGARSYISTDWLKEIKELFKIKNLIGYRSKEKTFRINGKLYKVDGFDPSTNTVFEFLGDYWHGYNTEDSRFRKTFIRLGKIAKVYPVVYVWEHDYKQGKPFSGVMGSIDQLLGR